MSFPVAPEDRAPRRRTKKPQNIELEDVEDSADSPEPRQKTESDKTAQTKRQPSKSSGTAKVKDENSNGTAKVKGQNSNDKKPLSMDIEDPTRDKKKDGRTKGLHNSKAQIQSCLAKKWVKIIIFLVAIVIETVDLVTDWFLFYDIYITAPGVVFGASEPSITWTLLAFSVFGTVTFLLEVINLFSDMLGRGEVMDGEIVSAVNVWAEDVPQMLINMAIAACRESATSYVQLTKASLVLFASLMRIIITVLRYKMSENYCRCSPQTKKRLRILVVVGMVVSFMCATAVFAFSNLYPDGDGTHSFHLPTHLYEDKQNVDRYFQDVHIFASGPTINGMCKNKSYTSDGDSWIRVVNVYDIFEAGDNGLIMQYDTDGGLYFQVSSWIDDSKKSKYVNTTYKLDNTKTCLFTKVSGFPGASKIEQGRFKFHYQKPTRALFPKVRLLMGDIQYVWTLKNDSTACVHGQDKIGSAYGRIKYARPRMAINTTTHLLETPKFWPKERVFQEYDLVPIHEVWKTGFWSCPTNGNTDPTFDLDRMGNITCA